MSSERLSMLRWKCEIWNCGWDDLFFGVDFVGSLWLHSFICLQRNEVPIESSPAYTTAISRYCERLQITQLLPLVWLFGHLYSCHSLLLPCRVLLHFSLSGMKQRQLVRYLSLRRLSTAKL